MPAVSFEDHPTFEFVDSTGAGDSFTSAFAVALSELMLQKGLSLAAALEKYIEIAKCMKFGSQAAFICISRFGVLAPTRSEINQVFGEQNL